MTAHNTVEFKAALFRTNLCLHCSCLFVVALFHIVSWWAVHKFDGQALFNLLTHELTRLSTCQRLSQ